MVWDTSFVGKLACLHVGKCPARMRARLQGLRTPAEPTTPPWRGTTVSAEDEPLLLTLQSAVKALLQTAQHLSMLTENASEVEVFCNTLEPVLLHKFKSRQFGIFTVHPWALVEHSEHRGDAEAEAVRLARSVGSSDAARLRAWIYVQLNQRSLRQTLSELLDDQAIRGMFFTEPALLNRLECRQLLSDLLRPLAGLSFRLGVAAGLASVAVVGDDDFQALRDDAADETPGYREVTEFDHAPPTTLLPPFSPAAAAAAPALTVEAAPTLATAPAAPKSTPERATALGDASMSSSGVIPVIPAAACATSDASAAANDDASHLPNLVSSSSAVSAAVSGEASPATVATSAIPAADDADSSAAAPAAPPAAALSANATASAPSAAASTVAAPTVAAATSTAPGASADFGDGVVVGTGSAKPAAAPPAAPSMPPRPRLGLGSTSIDAMMEAISRPPINALSFPGSKPSPFAVSAPVREAAAERAAAAATAIGAGASACLLYTSPSPRDRTRSRMPSSA